MKIMYKKLVRDNVPEICISNNQIPKFRVLDDKKYKSALKKKLKEEMREYLRDDNAEELADIIEVVEALANAQGSSFDEILRIKEDKAKKNGKFEKKYYLESVRK